MKQEVCVAVPIYKSRLNPFEEVGFRRLFEVLGSYPILGLMPRGFQFEPPAGTGGKLRRVEFDARYFADGESYSQLICSRVFYDALAEFGHVLLHQLDCYVFRDELMEWCGKGYDFIGAPIFEGFFPKDPAQVGSFVGNGGFSLRRVETFRKVLRSRKNYRPQRPFWRRTSLTEPLKMAKRVAMELGVCNGVASCTREHGEDIFWSRYARHFWPEFRVAPVEEGLRFSWDYAPRHCHALAGGKIPFGCHSWERYDLEFWREFIRISDEVAASLTDDMKGPKPFRGYEMIPGGALSQAHVREAVRRVAKRTLQALRFGLDDQIIEQMAFNRLGRKPPELIWKACARCPQARAEAAQATIGGRLYLMGGYETMDHVLSAVDVFDMRKGRWTDQFEMPLEIPQTHAGAACDDERFIYLAGGQTGPHCSPAVAACFVLDTWNQAWTEMPPLPEPRYTPVLRLWRGRLHAVAGSGPDRGLGSCDHWSIAVKEGRALEEGWRPEVPIPIGGTHRASLVIDDGLYVFGGHVGDIKAVPGDPQFTCQWGMHDETTLDDCFVLEHGAAQWKAIARMPLARGHTEHAVFQLGRCAVVVGGVESHDVYSDLIQIYDTRTDEWKLAGRLPYAMKTNAVYHKGWLYLITGQRTRSADDLRPGAVLNSVWRAKFEPAGI